MKSTIKKLLCVVSIATVFCSILFAPHTAVAYTSPGAPTDYVNDFAHVLQPQTLQSLNAGLQAYEASTTNQVAVVTVSSLGGDTVENYANSLFREWGIGQKDKNNGVLFLIAIEDRKMRIEVGYGLEGALTDLQSSKIISNIIQPYFKRGDYDTGVTEGLNAIITTISGDAAVVDALPDSASGTRGSSKDMGALAGLLIYGGIFAISWLGSLLGKTKSWWLGGVIGGIAGGIIGYVLLPLVETVTLVGIMTAMGLAFDFLVSKKQDFLKSKGMTIPWYYGGGFGGGSIGGGGGFGGFGGGSSGGGGASGSW